MAMHPSPAATTLKATSTKKEFLLFISIPAGIILLVMMVLFVPTLFAKPGYDFIYTSCSTYDCSGGIVVGADGFAKESSVSQLYNNDGQRVPEIYYHDIRDNSSREIEFSEASSYKLNASNVSPDGYKLTKGSNSGGGFLLWGYSSDDAWHLKKGSLQKKSLNLETPGYYYSSSVKLVGWVER